MIDHLPPGFRFCPTDEELIVHFLQRKVSLLPCHPHIIPDLDLYPYDPWDLEGKAMVEGKKLYYYSRRTQDRITTNGYWKSWGCDEHIRSSSNRNRIVGWKKYYVFHTGEAPEGVKTHWLMEEFSLTNGDSSSCSSSTGRSKRRGHSRLTRM
ncbi:hypothetical protein M8C21_023427 [Ambrosia artemisiifolia]|uniref:NAC domain-containing protein n=1 Tax=Ambrosia artemisiifolia TaxID=4212 RepID=A0AAD5GHQ3_AMBAR|nr:hypothetical protein M8C21_023427 [Ambrosia artemisiifolia]